MTRKISAKQSAHIERNIDSNWQAEMRRRNRIIAHMERNEDARQAAKERKAKRIADHQARNEAAKVEASTQAYALEIERRYGIVANDNYALARAA